MVAKAVFISSGLAVSALGICLVLITPLSQADEEMIPIVDGNPLLGELAEYWEYERPRRTRQNPNRELPSFLRAKPKDNRYLKETGCVGLMYLIKENGRTDQFRVISAYPNDKLVDFNKRFVKALKYVPVANNPDRQVVYVYAVTTTPGLPSKEASEIPEIQQRQQEVASICSKDLDKYVESLLKQQAVATTD